MNLESVLNKASEILAGATRSLYAQDVLYGYARWTGGDLTGKARNYSASYAHYRGKAAKALREAGGTIVSVEHGHRVSAVPAGEDNSGNALYQTTKGLYVKRPSRKNLIAVN